MIEDVLSVIESVGHIGNDSIDSSKQKSITELPSSPSLQNTVRLLPIFMIKYNDRWIQLLAFFKEIFQEGGAKSNVMLIQNSEERGKSL